MKKKLFTSCGRTYRLVEWWPFYDPSCYGCAFNGPSKSCPLDNCSQSDGINRVWRETVGSRIRRTWRRIRGR